MVHRLPKINENRSAQCWSSSYTVVCKNKTQGFISPLSPPCFGQLILILEFEEKLPLVDFGRGPASPTFAAKAQVVPQMLGRQYPWSHGAQIGNFKAQVPGPHLPLAPIMNVPIYSVSWSGVHADRFTNPIGNTDNNGLSCFQQQTEKLEAKIDRKVACTWRWD